MLDALYRQHAAFVARLAFRLLGRDGDVDDVVHDVFMALLRQVDSLTDPDDLRGWLTTVTVRMVHKRLRWNRLRRWVGLASEDHDESPAMVAPTATPEQGALVAGVYRALQKLSPDLRVAWMLRYVEEETLAEVALRCEVSLATAKRRIAAASHRLQAELGRMVERS